MQETISKIISNELIAKDIFRLKLKTKKSDFIPGQFAMLKVPGFFLRRPFCIADVEGEQITFVYKLVGDGTKSLSRMTKDQEVSLLWPLGNGFPNIKPDIVVAGGYGLATFYGLFKKLSLEGNKIPLFYGASNKDLMFMLDEFNQISNLNLATDDGSVGEKCFVTDLLKGKDLKNKTIFACGAMPMLTCLAKFAEKNDVNLFVSVESRMGCGWGVCLGCAVPAKAGNYLHACKDGPVLNYKLIDWDKVSE